jgi:hypothetical protein
MRSGRGYWLQACVYWAFGRVPVNARNRSGLGSTSMNVVKPTRIRACRRVAHSVSKSLFGATS